MLKPASLQRTDTIGIVAPSSPFDKKKYEMGISILKGMGFRIMQGAAVFEQSRYLAGSDEQRFRDFLNAFQDNDVAAVMAARGGYGTLRLLADVNFTALAARPKYFIGFSDSTSVLNLLVQKASVIAIHGPMVTTLPLLSEDSLLFLHKMLTQNDFPSLKWNKTEIIQSGNTQGTLVGGNLATLCHLVGTPYDIDYKGAIVMLEDVNEPLYKIDRMLTHLKLAGKFQGIKGFLLGDFGNDADTTAVWARVRELVSDPDVPIWGNMPFGHHATNYALPLGATAHMDDAGIVRFTYDE